MPRRGENIFKRKDGRWEARYIYTYCNGKAKYKYIYGKTYSEVKAKRNMLCPTYDIKKTPMEKQCSVFGEVAFLWLSDIRSSVKESTYTRYRRTVQKYIIPQFGKRAVSELDPHGINEYSEYLLREGGADKRALSPKTVTDILCVFRSVCRFGKVNGYPCPETVGIRYPKKEKREIKIFAEEQRRLLENAIFDSDNTTGLGIIFAVFLGLRIGEVCGLTWDDIDLEGSTVRISRTVERISDFSRSDGRKTKVVISEPKTESSKRVIPIPRFLCEYIYKMKKNGSGYILTGTDRFTEPHTFYIRYKNFLRRHGIEDNTFHALRHTFATRCIEAGFDTKSLAEILGHSSVTTTMNFYVHPSVERKREQMELLAPKM